MDERRAADEWMRDNLSQRLVAIETAQKLYHDEIKSITEGMHREIQAVKTEAMELHYALYGGPKADNVGLLERFRALLWKAGITTTFGFAVVAFILKLFTPSLTKLAERVAGVDPVSQFHYQATKKTLKHWNPKTKQWEYFIEFRPVGLDSPKPDKD